jgi:hypothetical protein
VKICEESNIDKPEAADLAAHDDTGDNTATAPYDDCLDLEAADLSELHLEKQVVTEDETESYEERELMRRWSILKGTG